MRQFWPDLLFADDFTQPHRDASHRVIRAGTRVAVLAVIVQTLIHTVNAIVTSNRYLSVNSENNPIAWAHGVAIFASAFVCALGALLNEIRRRTYLALAVILSFLSLDEVISIHERLVAEVIEALGIAAVWDSVLWPVIYLPLCGLLALLLANIASEAPRQAGQLIFVGLGCLAMAVVLEVVFARLSVEEGLGHTIEGGFEEAAEIVGWITIATALTAITIARIPCPPANVDP